MPKNNPRCYLCGKRLKAGEWKLRTFQNVGGGNLFVHKVCFDEKACIARVKVKGAGKNG